VLDQMRDYVRQRTRERIAARLASRAGTTAADREARRLDAEAACGHVTPANVVAYRDRHSLSQRDLAAVIGVSRGLVAEFERGRRYAYRVREWIGARLQEGQTQAEQPAGGA
jgi:DNA-binding transcriptional regulator YiaG